MSSTNKQITYEPSITSPEAERGIILYFRMLHYYALALVICGLT